MYLLVLTGCPYDTRCGSKHAFDTPQEPDMYTWPKYLYILF